MNKKQQDALISNPKDSNNSFSCSFKVVDQVNGAKTLDFRRPPSQSGICISSPWNPSAKFNKKPSLINHSLTTSNNE